LIRRIIITMSKVIPISKIPAHFNPETYAVIDKVTGEEVDIKIFISRINKDKWEKAYAQTLAEYIGVTGSASSKVLAYLISSRTSKNLILGTQREIAEELEISKKSVSTIFGILRNKNMLKEIRSGCYFLTPEIISCGNQAHGAMLLRLWDIEKQKS